MLLSSLPPLMRCFPSGAPAPWEGCACVTDFMAKDAWHEFRKQPQESTVERSSAKG